MTGLGISCTSPHSLPLQLGLGLVAIHIQLLRLLRGRCRCWPLLLRRLWIFGALREAYIGAGGGVEARSCDGELHTWHSQVWRTGVHKRQGVAGKQVWTGLRQCAATGPHQGPPAAVSFANWGSVK